MFLYPFSGGQAIEKATKGLLLFHDCYCMPTVLLQLQKQACQPKKSFVTITRQDRERLCDGGWLNDNLINFWLQWVTRMESHPDSSIHTMITDICTKLEHEGAESILHLTTKNNIDILSKKFVFVPIHKNQHWSLMVIVNAYLVDHFDELDAASEFPCMLHLDRLSLHDRKEIADKLRLWLNAAWKKNKTSSFNLFTTITMDSFSLTGEHYLHIKFDNYFFTIMTTSNLFFLHLVQKQTNSFDCSVYLCQFALSMYSHHFHLFTYIM
jgi:Ulp1 family protease